MSRLLLEASELASGSVLWFFPVSRSFLSKSSLLSDVVVMVVMKMHGCDAPHEWESVTRPHSLIPVEP